MENRAICFVVIKESKLEIIHIFLVLILLDFSHLIPIIHLCTKEN